MEEDLAGIGWEAAGDDVEKGGLARPDRSDETDDLAMVALERDAVERMDAAEAFGHACHAQHVDLAAVTVSSVDRSGLPLGARLRAAHRSRGLNAPDPESGERSPGAGSPTG
jgi:hypothetical protein